MLLALDALFGVVLLGVAFLPALLSALNPPPRAHVVVLPPQLVRRMDGIALPGQPVGFAMAPDGTLGLVDRGRGVVMHLDSAGRATAEWGPRFGSGLDAQDLLGLAADADGWYVLDRSALRVLRLDTNGRVEPERTIDLKPLAPYGPNGLGVDQRGNLYVADTGRDRVLVFDTSGRLVNTIGDSGRDLGKLRQPMGVAIAPDGSLLVADWENGRVERWNAQMEPASAWPLPSPALGVAVDPAGRVYVPDGDQRLVRAYSGDGQFLFQLGGSDAATRLPVESPVQVAVSPDGATLWVLGTDGLSTVDLRPFAEVRPSEVAAPVRWPLAVAGVVLLGVAGAVSFAPRFSSRRPRPAVTIPRVAATASPVVELGTRAARRLLPSPPWLHLAERQAVLIGGTLAVLGAAGAVVGALSVLDPQAQSDPWPRMTLLVLSCLACAVGIALTTPVWPLTLVTAWPACAVASPVASSRAKLQALAMLAGPAVLALVAGVLWWQQRFQTPEATRAAALWLLGVAIVGGVVARWCEWRRPEITWRATVPWLLFALALAPRIWNQADLPYGIWFDEAESALQARRFLQDGRYTPIADTFGRDASLFYYLVAAVLQVVRDPVVAVRGTAAVLGALNAPLVYLLGRELWGWRVGVLAGVLLALSRWHLDVSRLGMTTILAPVFATLAFWLLARAVRRERWVDAAWAGIAFGLGLHGYIGFRAMPVIAIVLGLYAALLYRWRPADAAVRSSAFVGGFVLVALPVLVFAVQDPTSFNGRLNQTLIFNENVSQAQKLDELWSTVQKHALMFHVHGDMNGRHNLPGWPMLDPFSGVLALLGLAWLVVHIFDWRGWLVFGWGIVAMSGGIFTLPFEAPQAIRTFAVTPLLALLAAIGLILLADRLSLGRRRTVVTGLSVVVALALGVLNVHTFFARQMQDPAVWESFSTRETIPVRTALEGAGYEAILGSATIAPSVESGLLPLPLRETIRAFNPSTDLPYRGAGPALIVLETEHDSALVDEVMRFYPDARRVPILAPDAPRPLVEEVILDRDMLARWRGIDAVGDGAWRALLAVDVPGIYRFGAPAGAQLSLDGSAPFSTARFELTRGNHLLDARAVLPPGQQFELLWQPPGATALRVIDPRALFLPPEGGNGLAATLYPTQVWQGSPRDDLIDPFVAHYFHSNPFSRLNFDPHNSWSAEWQGFLNVPTTGTYRFEADRQSRAGMWLDERVIFDDTAEGAAETTTGTTELDAGEHRIRVRFQDRGDGGPRLYLYWTPPGGPRQVIPGRVLYPPRPIP